MLFRRTHLYLFWFFIRCFRGENSQDIGNATSDQKLDVFGVVAQEKVFHEMHRQGRVSTKVFVVLAHCLKSQ